uniref:Uncharacterized protein MANES_15G192700 n=1 Tax=Rhizophora mucronata TaxID=61149 RepID=A0A2P2MUI2_RHIMU
MACIRAELPNETQVLTDDSIWFFSLLIGMPLVEYKLIFPHNPDSLSYQYLPGYNFHGGNENPSSAAISSGFRGNPFTISCSGQS